MLDSFLINVLFVRTTVLYAENGRERIVKGEESGIDSLGSTLRTQLGFSRHPEFQPLP